MTTSRALRWGAALLFVVALTAAAPPHPLLDAARRGDVAAVRTLLRSGADPSEAQGDGLTALHIAAEQGNLDLVRLLIEAKAKVDATTRLGAYTPLHLAAQGARTAVVDALLEAGADPDLATTTSGVSPLHLAAQATNGEGAVRALLEHGAAVDARERSAGQTALMFAASAGRTASVRELLGRGADPAASTEVMDVLQRMFVDKAAEKWFQEASTEIKSASAEGTDRELTPAEEQAAIAKQRESLRSSEAVRQVLETYDVNALATMRPWWNTPQGFKSEVTVLGRPQIETLVRKSGGMTALLHAAREGHVETAVALLDGGADIDQRSGDGSTALVLALLNGQFDLAKMLIERGADPNVATETDGISPLFAVLQTQWAFKFTEQPQPLAHENLATGYMELLNALLERGADPNVRLKTHLWFLGGEGRVGLDLTGATPFWRAAIAQDLDAMKALAAHGADPSIPTLWPEAGMRGTRQQDGRNQEDSGLPVMAEGLPNMYPIHAAAGGGFLGLGAYQISNVPNNFLAVVKYLVEEHGIDVNLPDSWGYTPLHYASVRGGNDLIEYLVSKGGDLKAVSRLGQSVADMARGGNGGYFNRPAYPGTVELLQGMGAPFVCLSTHFRGTGDYCPLSGVPPFEQMTTPGEQKPAL